MKVFIVQWRATFLAASLAAAWAVALISSMSEAAPRLPDPPGTVPVRHPGRLFLTSHECVACHNGLTTPTGEDVSIGLSWRASMMANSSRDPYWQASVRREIADHSEAAEAIEDECAVCHMPMSHTKARAENRHGRIFEHLAIQTRAAEDDRLAADGVSCTVCHQIASPRLGTRESFNGGFVLAEPTAAGERRMFGPFEIDTGRRTLMQSATGMTPAEAAHLRESEVCATCHTLFTEALGPNGEVLGQLAEQVPYLEWRHSAFRQERSCQSCHMPAVQQPTRIASVLGEERVGLGRHTFVGGNFFILRMLNRYRDELRVEALPQELEAAATAALAQLQQDTATVIASAAPPGPGQWAIDVAVRNLAGHKLPTAYPSRRAWLHVTVRDRDGQRMFESGAAEPSGRIRGNDNDEDAARFEPHHGAITRADEVQIYESIMGDVNGNVTTGCCAAPDISRTTGCCPAGSTRRPPRRTSRSWVRRATRGLRRWGRPRAIRRRHGWVDWPVSCRGRAAVPANLISLGGEPAAVQCGRDEALRRLVRRHGGWIVRGAGANDAVVAVSLSKRCLGLALITDDHHSSNHPRRSARWSPGGCRVLHLLVRERVFVLDERPGGVRQLPHHAGPLRCLDTIQPPIGRRLQRLSHASWTRSEICNQGAERLLAFVLLHDGTVP